MQTFVDDRSQFDKLRRSELEEVARKQGITISPHWIKSDLLRVLNGVSSMPPVVGDVAAVPQKGLPRLPAVNDAEVDAALIEARNELNEMRHFVLMATAKKAGVDPDSFTGRRDDLIEAILKAL